jgi:hypothetical protein
MPLAQQIGRDAADIAFTTLGEVAAGLSSTPAETRALLDQARSKIDARLARSVTATRFNGDDLGKGGMTAGVAPYIHDPRDVALLLQLHRTYVDLCARAYETVCSAGGLALSPHTYGPRTMGIAKMPLGCVASVQRMA